MYHLPSCLSYGENAGVAALPQPIRAQGDRRTARCMCPPSCMGADDTFVNYAHTVSDSHLQLRVWGAGLLDFGEPANQSLLAAVAFWLPLFLNQSLLCSSDSASSRETRAIGVTCFLNQSLLCSGGSGGSSCDSQVGSDRDIGVALFHWILAATQQLRWTCGC